MKIVALSCCPLALTTPVPAPKSTCDPSLHCSCGLFFKISSVELHQGYLYWTAICVCEHWSQLDLDRVQFIQTPCVAVCLCAITSTMCNNANRALFIPPPCVWLMPCSSVLHYIASYYIKLHYITLLSILLHWTAFHIIECNVTCYIANRAQFILLVAVRWCLVPAQINFGLIPSCHTTDCVYTVIVNHLVK